MPGELRELRKVDRSLAEQTTRTAAESPRRRAVANFHEHADSIQRLMNCAWPDSYFRPHRHRDADHVEVLVALAGRAVVLLFDESGHPIEGVAIDGNGPCYAVEVPPRIWHALLVVAGPVTLYEVASGPYQPETREMADWSPEDGAEGVRFLTQAARALGLVTVDE